MLLAALDKVLRGIVVVCGISSAAMPDPPTPAASPSFDYPLTDWSVVRQAQSPADSLLARHALARLCELYRGPAVAYARHLCGERRDEAEDIVHNWLQGVLRRDDIGAVDPCFGKFRHWVRAGVRHEFQKHLRHASAARRGGGVEPLALDADGHFPGLPHDGTSPADLVLDLAWITRIIEESRRRLECRSSRDAEAARAFAVLSRWLPGGAEPAPGEQQAAAEELGLNAPAFRKRVERLRQSLQQTVCEVVIETCGSKEEAAEELRHLLGQLPGGIFPDSQPAGAAL